MPVVATATSSHPPVKSSLAQFVDDLGSLIRPPRPLPGVAERVADVVRQVRAARGPVVLWVPGTSGTAPSPEFLAAVQRRIPGATVITVPYQATWRLAESEADGAAVFRGVIAALDADAAASSSARRVLIAGESQGAWIIGDVLAARSSHPAVRGVALLAHPGVALSHYDGGSANPISVPVREFNSATDLVSRPIVGAERTRVINLIESVSRLRLLDVVVGAAIVIATDPALPAGLISSQLFRFKAGAKNPHDTEDRLDAAVSFLAACAVARP